MDHWTQLGAVKPEDLSDMRTQMHYASMLVAAPAHTLIPKREDHSQDALSWVPENCALCAEPVEGLICLLTLEAGELLVSADGGTPERFQLHGLTMAEARRRLAEILSRRLQRTVTLRLPIEDYGEEMPEHALGSGESFQWDEAQAKEIAHYFDNAAWAIRTACSQEAGASPLRIWPHHFDMAALITYGRADPKRYIGVGFSPGDQSYPEGYFYVNPWPGPDPSVTLPDLPEGAVWHRDGWTGAVLSTNALLEAADQQSAVRRYQMAAMLGQKKLLAVS